MPGRLSLEPSPYLRQHADNPVDWYPWGEEAFDRARLEDKPVFLSVGYSSCHWCHVMAHESFEDEEIAAALNRSFVSVKVDREERPDVDETYMAAVQLASGRGGWPMSVFLTPDRLPFHAGTYYPPRDAGGHIGFLSVVEQLAAAWRERRQDVERVAQEFRNAIEQAFSLHGEAAERGLGHEQVEGAIRQFEAEFDRRHGGFGGAPKFPPHGALRLLARVARLGGSEASAAREMLTVTLRGIALGGIHDHVGGGFHRYATDERWFLPHFEKMLYDNALLLDAYSQAIPLADAADRPIFERAQSGIVHWLAREMVGEDGLFYSALDADSEGEEGRFYTWEAADLRRVLGAKGERALEGFGATEDGNYREEATKARTGRNVLFLPRGAFDGLEESAALLLAERSMRVRPTLDDKSILAWNGMAICGLVQAGVIDRAVRCADGWLAAKRRHGRWPHMVVRGAPHGDAYLDDLAWFANGLLSLGDAGLPGYREEAEALAKEVVERFWSPDRGAFASTGPGHEELIGRSWPVFDGALPSASAVAIEALVRLGERSIPTEALSGLSGAMVRAPRATPSLHAALLGLMASTGALGSPAVAPRPKKIGLNIEWSATREDRRREGSLILDLPNGWHVNSHEPTSPWLAPTVLSFPDVTAEVDYPASEDGVYRGRVRIDFRLSGVQAGEQITLELQCQPCTEDGCQTPQRMRLDLKVPSE